MELLDAWLMQGSMSGWRGMQELLRDSHGAFDFYKMKTRSGHCGAMLECTVCDKARKISWRKMRTSSASRKKNADSARETS